MLRWSGIDSDRLKSVTNLFIEPTALVSFLCQYYNTEQWAPDCQVNHAECDLTLTGVRFSELPTTGGAGPAPLYQTGAVTGAPAATDYQLGGVRSVWVSSRCVCLLCGMALCKVNDRRVCDSVVELLFECVQLGLMLVDTENKSRFCDL